MLLKLYGDVKFPKLRIGDEDAKAPMAMCGYFNLNHAASTAKTNKLIYIISHYVQNAFITFTKTKTKAKAKAKAKGLMMRLAYFLRRNLQTPPQESRLLTNFA